MHREQKRAKTLQRKREARQREKERYEKAKKVKVSLVEALSGPNHIHNGHFFCLECQKLYVSAINNIQCPFCGCHNQAIRDEATGEYRRK